MSFTGKPQAFLDTVITNDGFYPDVALAEFQRAYRVPAEYKSEVIEHHMRLAIADCNTILAVKKRSWLAEGKTYLAEVDDTEIGGKNAVEEQYLRAVYCQAMGLLVRAFATLNRREQAENVAKESDDTEQDYFAQAYRALRRLLGRAENLNVELL